MSFFQYGRIVAAIRPNSSTTGTVARHSFPSAYPRTVTSRGRPVARVTSVDDTGSKEAFDRMMASLKARPLMQIKPWKREDLYE